MSLGFFMNIKNFFRFIPKQNKSTINHLNTLVWNKIKQEMKPQTQTTTSLYLKSSDVVQQLHQVCQSEPNLE